MKAVELQGFGGPENLVVVDVPTPSVGPRDVLIRVKASGLNFSETAMRNNRYVVTPPLPSILGSEVAGIVTAVGRDVDSVRIGDRVACSTYASGQFFGGYAEYATCDVDYVTPLPEALPFDQAVALMVQGLTAYYLLERSPVAGKNVLVAAAAGGVGSLLVQLAKQAGAKQVIAAASTQDKRDFARSLGADSAIDYTADGWSQAVRDLTAGAGADVIYESAGGAVTGESLKALAPLGEMVVYGSLNVLDFNLGVPELLGLIFQNQSIKGFATVPLLTPHSLRNSQTHLFNLAAAGALKVTIGGRYPLEQAGAAHMALESRQSRGKIVLEP